MSLDQYFSKLPKDAPLPVSLKPSAQPTAKRFKRGPGRPRKIRETALTRDCGSDSGSDSGKENEGDIERSRGMKRL